MPNLTDIEKRTLLRMPSITDCENNNFIYERLQEILSTLRTNVDYQALNREIIALHHSIQRVDGRIDSYEEKCCEAQEMAEKLIYERAFNDGFAVGSMVDHTAHFTAQKA